jgi:hypothetical protein
MEEHHWKDSHTKDILKKANDLMLHASGRLTSVQGFLESPFFTQHALIDFMSRIERLPLMEVADKREFYV